MTELGDDLHLGEDEPEQVAVVGLSGRFPGAPDVDTFWDNLKKGVDSLRTFSADELAELGIPQALTERDNFVARGSILEGYDRFDAERFGFRPREAAMTDPQARVFIETAHQALEHAGYAPFDTPGEVGVFAGCNPVDYALLLGQPDITDSLTSFDQMIGNDRDFLATRVSHRLGLTGPALNVQSACSTSLVAIHLAAQHLLDFQCSMAIAGGVSLNFRQGIGYFAQQGMILSPDGVCRAFDDRANGTVLGQASAAVVLKRLSDAIDDGDTIHAVIAASGLNNDGRDKISYTAPSADGQAEVIATTHALAGLTGDDITYVETHGTGTHLGDPVEIAGLTRAFRLTSDAVRHCAIGSVKTNVGHTDAAAGVTGFIKAVLAVRDGVIPPSLNFDAANEAIDFESSPFFVATECAEWKPTTTDLRRAGVSSFGIGGTNAHAIVAEPPPGTGPPGARQDSDRPRIAVVSAPTEAGAAANLDQVSDWATFGRLGDAELATLVEGRSHHSARQAALVSGRTTRSTVAGFATEKRPAIWMFSGQGAQFAGMAAGAHGSLDAFTETIEQVMSIVAECSDLDLAPLLLAERDDVDAADRLRQTQITQPALFAVQCAAAAQLRSWGATPSAVIGHSIGEFAAAVTAGVMTLEGASRAVVHRGRLMQAMVPGAMVAVRLGADDLRSLLVDGTELATDNSSTASVAAGPYEAIAELETVLSDRSISFQRLETSHAFHTESMAPAASQFAAELRDLELRSPEIPMLSNVTGAWMTPDEATDHDRWARQIRETVRFTDCLSTIVDSGDSSPIGGADPVLLEIGPGTALSAFATRHDDVSPSLTTIVGLGGARSTKRIDEELVETAGSLWVNGLDIDLSLVNESGLNEHRRVPAPMSVLQSEEHWAPQARHVLALGDSLIAQTSDAVASKPAVRNDVDEWCFERSFRRQPSEPDTTQRVVVLTTDGERNQAILRELRDRVGDVIEIRLGNTTELHGSSWTMAPADDNGARAIIDRLAGTSRRPDRIIHLWLADEQSVANDVATLRRRLDVGVNTMLSLARAAAGVSQDRTIHLASAATGVHDVLGDEAVLPGNAAIGGPVKVIPLEYSGLTTRLIDLPTEGPVIVGAIADELLARPDHHPIVAVRGRHRWVHDIAPRTIPVDDTAPIVKPGGSYLIVGGLGGVGLSIAHHLATSAGAHLTLTGRSGDPRLRSGSPNPELERRLERLNEIEEHSASLTILSADTIDEDQTIAAVRAAQSATGRIDGVIVTAAVADTEGAIHRRTSEAAEAAISAKVHGAVVLARALTTNEQPDPIDFVLLSSSIASQLFHNRFGQVGYVTANSYAEAAAESNLFPATRVLTVAWDDWVEVGMSVRAADDFAERHGADIVLMDELHSFTPADGVGVFERALRTDAPALFVSTTDLPARVAADRFVESPFLQRATADVDTDEEGSHETLGDALLETWRSLLGIDDIKPDDDFFDLGGDSLQVARMADKLGRILGTEVALDLIFDNARFVSMETALTNLAKPDAQANVVVHHDEVEGERPATASQQRFFDRGSHNPHHFNVSSLLEVRTPLSVERAHGLVDEAVERHDALRTRFRRSDDGWVRRVEPDASASLAFDHLDLRHLSVDEADAEAEAAMTAWQGALHLENGPTSRVAFIERPDGHQRLFIVMHHLLSDRISLLALLEELDDAIDRPDAELARPPVPYSAWADALGAHPSSPEGVDDRSRWERLLERPAAPLIGEPTEALNRRADGRRIELDDDLSASILRNENGRADEIVLLALSDALCIWSDVDDAIGIDVLGHGRRILSNLDVSRTIGFFLTYSPVWLDRTLDAPGDRVASLRHDVERAWTFDVLRQHDDAFAVGRDRPEVLFNYVGRPIASSDARHLLVSDEPHGSDTDPHNRRGHALAVMVEITTENQVALTIVHDTDRFDEAAMDHLTRTIESRLAELGTST